MELRRLRYFAAVAEDLSFRRAARRLHVSHPSLSQQIGDLEDELGLKLFKWNSRRVELTEAGRIFLAEARQTLSSAQRAVAQTQEVAKGERGRLVIGNIGLLTHTFLPAALETHLPANLKLMGFALLNPSYDFWRSPCLTSPKTT
jgi:LysR family hca operon transcriptional activator